ncbi:MAG: hypothetical protein M0Q13_00385 [Methanothrix sp.]|jgi:hypothetical protein|nr:hypothetical protein [Methanothrix sp.]
MLSAKYAALVFGVMLIALAFNVSAQWSPGGAMVYMGDLNLAASSVSSGKAVQAPEGSQEIQEATNNSSLNNSSINGTTIDNSTLVGPSIVVPCAGTSDSSGKKILDLSGYASDRTNKSLAGYTNIMYPISGSRGTTTSTAGGGGGCGGCS